MAGKPKQKTPISSTSLRPIVEGVPAPMLFFGDLVLNLQDYLEDAVNQALVVETEEAKKGLVSADPSYSELVDDFRLGYNKNEESFTYKVIGKSGQKAKDLEYGPPGRSILRHQCIVGSKRLTSNINRQLDMVTGMRTHK
jgi:hypothetical protein